MFALSGHVPFSEAMWCALGAATARLLRPSLPFVPPPKCVVVDHTARCKPKHPGCNPMHPGRNPLVPGVSWWTVTTRCGTTPWARWAPRV